MTIDPLRDAKPFALWPVVPPSIQAIMPNVTWDRARLARLELPLCDIPVASLRWQLDLPWWRNGDRVFSVTPNQVRNAPERFVVQWRRTLDSDLDWPIHLLDRGRLVLLDGVHRLLKADVLEMRTISARVLDVTRFSEILVRS
jgi:hypothetical protein